jgi:transcriptional regulator with XRE-family HTH domain
MSDKAKVINAQVEQQLLDALNGGERTTIVVDLTRRALTLRAKGISVEDIADTEQVEFSTLESWMQSSRRTPTPAEAQAMLDNEAVPLAIENHVHLLRAGNTRATMQTMAGILKPKKKEESKTLILVGVGTGPIGKDPLE